MQKTGPYDPCPCNSGQKYKFCCYLKRRQGTEIKLAKAQGMSKVLFSPTPKQQEEFEKIASSIFRGLKYMADNDLMSAVECFKRAQKGAPGIPTGGNNLAMCLFLLGKHEEAVATQEKCNEMSSIPNTFGLANLALFLRLGNNLEEGNTKLDTALGLDMPSIDAILRLCQVLAIYKRHEDILALTEKYAPFIDDTIKFYRGCAVANLGRNSEAAVLFKGVSSGFKVGMACVYSQWLSIGNAPSTVNGDWYYFNVNEMMGLISLVLVGENVDSVLTVDLIESMINDITEGVGHREMLQLLGKCKHPEALGVWLIAQVRYYKEKNNTEEMLSCFRMAYMYFPSHPMWEFYEDEFIEMGLIDEDEFDD